MSPSTPRIRRSVFVAREAFAYARQGVLGRDRRTASLGDGPGPAVVFVHGHLAGSGSFLPLRRALAEQGVTRFLAYDYPPRGSIGEVARGLDALVSRHLGREPVVLVGHSLGGIIARAWLQQVVEPERALALITLSTPHRGLPLPALTRRVPLVGELNADGPFMARLTAGVERLSALPRLSIVSSRDHLLRSPEVARLDGAELVVVDHAGHAGILFAEDVHQLVVARVREAGNRTEPTPRGMVTAHTRGTP